MYSFRKSEIIWTLIIVIVLQTIIIYSMILINEQDKNKKDGKFDNYSSELIIKRNEYFQNDGSFYSRLNSYLKRVHSVSQEVWNYLSVNLKTINNFNNSKEENRWTQKILKEISDMKNVIQLETKSLSTDLSNEEWLQKESDQLSKEILNHLNQIQNPTLEKCVSGQTIICNHTNTNGFASGLHDIVFCLIAGYYSNKTVVLLTKKYHYLKNGNQWTDYFMPLSNTCDEKLFLNTSKVSEWPGINTPVNRRLLHYLPKSIGKRIVSFHSSPQVWWFGFFASYIMRPQLKIKRLLNQRKSKLNFTHPIVGLHVRRTDKIGNEGSFHNISEYMTQIDDFYNKYELLDNTSDKRKVYLATDDPNLWKECTENYRNYEFIGNKKSSVLASNLKTRYNENSFLDLIIDIYLLSETDYIVCTMSSGMCRLAFELMQKFFRDGGFRAHSLDVPFHYDFLLNPSRIAIYNHKSGADDEWSLRVGDTLNQRNGMDWMSLAKSGKRLDSYIYGVDLLRTKFLKYPSYKTVQKILLY